MREAYKFAKVFFVLRLTVHGLRLR